jgi:hypothetical protein
MRFTESDFKIIFGTAFGISLQSVSEWLSVFCLGATLIYTVIRICKELK